ncbi:MAG: glycosyltransferase family 9 protein [Armatimonadia bacterium]
MSDRQPRIHYLPEDARVFVQVRANIGDSLFALPAIDALRQRYPQARIVFATSPAAGSLFYDDPRLSGWVPAIPYGGGRLRYARALRDYWSRLRKEGFDAHVELDAGGKVPPWIVWLAGVPLRLGCRGEEGGGGRWHAVPRWLLTDTVPVPDSLGLHRAHGFLRLMELLDCDPTPRPIRLLLTEERRERARQRLEGLGLRPPVVAIHPGASWRFRRWPAERVVETARQLAKDGAHLLALGGEADAEVVSELVKAAGATAILTPNVRDLVDLLSAVDVCVGNDSGPVHLAAAVGTAVVGLYGPNLATYTGPDPLHRRARVLSAQLPCAPCAQGMIDPLAECKRPQGAWCMEQIEVSDVLQAVRDLLSGS